MSHTTTVVFRDKVCDVHHNSDWSGEAVIDYDGREVTRVPCALLLKIGQAAVVEKFRDEVVSFVESWESDPTARAK